MPHTDPLSKKIETTSAVIANPWKAVLTGTPHFDKLQWETSSFGLRWFVAVRASLLVLTLTSAVIAGLLAWLSGAINFVLWLACVFGLLLAHASNNILNDYIDFARGLDQGNYYRVRYGTHVLNDGLVSKRKAKVYILLTGSAALVSALGILIAVDWRVLTPVAIGAFILLFYTYPLKTLGLGEMAVLLVWGPLMVGGTFHVVSGYWSWPVSIVGAVTALGPTSVILAKHVDKLSSDEAKGVRTLPVRLGEACARKLIQLTLLLMYASVLMCIVIGWLPTGTLLICLAIPAAIDFNQILNSEKPAQCPSLYPEFAWPLWFAAHAFSHARKFGLYLVLGLGSGVFL